MFNVGYLFDFQLKQAKILQYHCGLTTLNKPKSGEVSTNDGIITQNIFNAAVPTSIETK